MRFEKILRVRRRKRLLDFQLEAAVLGIHSPDRSLAEGNRIIVDYQIPYGDVPTETEEKTTQHGICDDNLRRLAGTAHRQIRRPVDGEAISAAAVVAHAISASVEHDSNENVRCGRSSHGSLDGSADPIARG